MAAAVAVLAVGAVAEPNPAGEMVVGDNPEVETFPTSNPEMGAPSDNAAELLGDGAPERFLGFSQEALPSQMDLDYFSNPYSRFPR